MSDIQRFLLHIALTLTIALAGYSLQNALAADKHFTDRWQLSRSSPKPLPESAIAQPSEKRLIRPQPVSRYFAESPASLMPYITWTKVDGAVFYEFELLSDPSALSDTPSPHRLFATRSIFANGYHLNLAPYANSSLYWRVLALDLYGKAIGEYSQPEKLYVDSKKTEPLQPLPTALFNSIPAPLYPVYYWLPINGAAKYEVEIMNMPPENPGGVNPSAHRIAVKTASGYGIYSDKPVVPGIVYYWRVRALAADGSDIGIYSDAVRYQVELEQGRYAATFGDSITHGGGAVSYSPADPEYSFQTYLEFPQLNLGRSGDTSAGMLERFERDVLPVRPRNLIILGGTNSLRGGTPAQSVIADLAAIRQKCLINNIRPIFLTLPPINPTAIEKVFNEQTALGWRKQFDLVNAFIRRQSYHIDIEPFFLDANRELPVKYSIDGLHLDIEGKKLLADIINHNWGKVSR